jgi:sec-independent protein translocase protein TatB
MFDIGWQELFVIAVLALIVVGPKDLPRAVRTISSWVRKARALARDFQDGVNEMVREAELDDIKDHLTKPQDMKKAFTDTVDPDGSISKGLVFDGELDLEKKDPVSPKDDEAVEPENVIGDVSDPSEAGEAHQFEVAAPPLDDDVMPVPAPSVPQKAESGK